MPIRINGLLISEELLEKLNNLSFANQTGSYFSPEEVYLCKLMADEGLTENNIRPSHVFDVEARCVRQVLEVEDNSLFKCKGDNSYTVTHVSDAFILPSWSESRAWLLTKGFKLDFHYDPFFKEEKIKMGFMKPKSQTVPDNIIIEVEGRTDLESVYKVILEVLKYEKTNSNN